MHLTQAQCILHSHYATNVTLETKNDMWGEHKKTINETNRASIVGKKKYILKENKQPASGIQKNNVYIDHGHDRTCWNACVKNERDKNVKERILKTF